MKWCTCHMINVVSGTKPCKLFTSERRHIARDYSILDPMRGKDVVAIATWTHLENACIHQI